MSIIVQRINDSTYSVNFPNEKHKKLIIEIEKKEGFDSKIDNNQEFFYHLVTDVAKNIQAAKSTHKSFNNVIAIGEKEWVIKVKHKTSSVASQIFPAIHKQGDDQVVRLAISPVDNFNPLSLVIPGMNVVYASDQVSQDNEYNDKVLSRFNLEKAKSQNKEDCKHFSGMMACTEKELARGIRGKMAYDPNASFKDRIKSSIYSSPFSSLASLAFQRYETEFQGSDHFKTSDCKYCLILQHNQVVLVPRSEKVESNLEANSATIKAFTDLMTSEVGSEKLESACLLGKIDLKKMLKEGAPLTPEHIYRLNVLITNVEVEDLQQFLNKIKTLDLNSLKSKSFEEAFGKILNLREVRGLLHVVKEETGRASKQSVIEYLKKFQEHPQLDKLTSPQVDQLARIFFPAQEEWNLVFTGRDIYYPIKSAYTLAGKKEYKPWVDQQELLQSFPVLQKTNNWDLYDEKLSHVICKKHLFRAHPTKQYTTGALIPAPLGEDGKPRWMQVDQAVYNGYGMLNYTLKPLGNDPSLPLIKLYVSTASNPYAVFGQKTIRTDFNPLQLTGYEGLGKTDIYETAEILQNSIPVWAGYVFSATQAIDDKKPPAEALRLLSKANAELFKYEVDKAKVYSLPQILRRHNGILNSLFLKGKMDLYTYEHLRNEYLKKTDFRENKAEYLTQVKNDTEKLIARLAEIKFDLSDFSETMQPQVATEMDALIQELNSHLLIPDATSSKKQLMNKLGEKILDECIAYEQVVFDMLQLKDLQATDYNKINSFIEDWTNKLIDYAKQTKEIPTPSETRDIHFVGHSLGGSFAQIYSLHHLVKQNRIPFPGHQSKVHAFDSPGVAREDNELFKKFLLDHHDMMQSIDTKFTVIHQHEASDPVHTVGTHLGSAKSAGEAKAILDVLDFQASVMKRLPNATHPTLANAQSVHGTQFLEGVEGVDYTRREVNPHDMGLMESYETMKDLPKDILMAKGEQLRQEVWQFPLPLSTSSFEGLRSNPSTYWMAGQLLANMVESEPEMIPFLDPMGNFSANTKGLNYADKDFYTSTLYPSQRPSWIQKLSEAKLRAKLYPGSDLKSLVRTFGNKAANENLEEASKALLESYAQSRKFMLDLGGERVTIKTSAGNLDGLILQPNKLAELLKDAGVIESHVKLGDMESKVWLLDADKPKHVELVKAMENMRFFKMGLRSSFNGSSCLIGEDKFVKALEVDPSAAQFSEDKAPDLPKSDKGVLICGGNMSVYEMFSSEAASFLLRGMNVMLFNPPGFGESEGTPNEETLTEGILAAYDTLAKKAQLNEENILIKSLCMSGGWASTLAKQHPNAALWLDQTYSSFYPLVQSTVVSQLPDSIPKQFEGIIGDLIPQFCVPAFDVGKNLSQHKGWKCLMYANEDEVIPPSHVLRNIDSTEDSKPTKVIQIPGKHSQSWYRLKGVADVEASTEVVKDQVDAFLKRAGFLNPVFPVTTT